MLIYEREDQMNTRHLLHLALAILLVSLAACAVVDQFTGENVNKEIRENGLPAKAKVLKIWDTGIKVNDDPVVGFLLEVHAEGLEPYQAETKALISILAIPQIQPGKILPVKYDPKDPKRVALDIYEDR